LRLISHGGSTLLLSRPLISFRIVSDRRPMILRYVFHGRIRLMVEGPEAESVERFEYFCG